MPKAQSGKPHPGPIVLKQQCLKARMARLNRKNRNSPSPAGAESPTAPVRRGPGAPAGNSNRLVHGRYSREHLAFRAAVTAFGRACRALVEEVRPLFPPTKAGRPRGPGPAGANGDVSPAPP